MDETNIIKYSGVSSGFTFLAFILYKAIKYINNKRIHSSCNGHNLDIELTTIEIPPPPPPTPILQPQTTNREISEVKI